jgi:hypothetical protein
MSGRHVPELGLLPDHSALPIAGSSGHGRVGVEGPGMANEASLIQRLHDPVGALRTGRATEGQGPAAEGAMRWRGATPP